MKQLLNGEKKVDSDIFEVSIYIANQFEGMKMKNSLFHTFVLEAKNIQIIFLFDEHFEAWFKLTDECIKYRNYIKNGY